MARRAHRLGEDLAPLAEVEAQEVMASEREEIVGRVEERAVEARGVDPAREGEGYRRPARRPHEDFEIASAKALERLFDGRETADLVERAGDAAAAEHQRALRHHRRRCVVSATAVHRP